MMMIMMIIIIIIVIVVVVVVVVVVVAAAASVVVVKIFDSVFFHRALSASQTHHFNLYKNVQKEPRTHMKLRV
ncbi:hypothetical protein ElyMa_003206800 [Elysia marginata]|uniref:Secreted protein n=1 Tax=Elysia marginata TaxID=1093978 RepID=A0AAV4J1F9_9GAST|nr:hypothetical protein ElyMa_003206800 [Elysia marginata]